MVTYKQILLDFVEFLYLVAHILYCYCDYILTHYFLPKEPKSLKGAIVLVTGSGRGIGREICLQLAECGAIVVGWSKSAEPNEALRKEILKRGGVIHCYTVDVSNRIQVEETAALVKKQVGDVSIVINNAGLMRVQSFLDTSPEDIESLFQVNVFSNFWVLRAFLPEMIQRGEGHLVTVCSASALLPTRNLVPYSSTKHAVHGYIEALRDELRHHPKKPNIKMTTTFPFYCNTTMLDGAIPNTRLSYLIPVVTPEDVAASLIKGIREETEYIYTPVLMGWLAMFSWLVPPKSIIAWSEYVKCHIDPAIANNQKDK
ncbi:unnamed protein product [Allacma fusca]|uniref:Short-chain dehydrogenase/reductase 3 n=1 Tax=Allacma fusca TaxID=39272 RepID=A0A8J2PM80_9HEXA|nr:unnamed protein product [Allacma fusca]